MIIAYYPAVYIYMSCFFDYFIVVFYNIILYYILLTYII